MNLKLQHGNCGERLNFKHEFENDHKEIIMIYECLECNEIIKVNKDKILLGLIRGVNEKAAYIEFKAQ